MAIIGGFLISRTLSARTERRTLTVQRHAIEAQVAVLRSEREALDEQLFRDDWVPWLQEVAHGIAASAGTVSVEDALSEVPSVRTADELRPVFEKATEVVLSALQSFEPAFQPDTLPPPELEEMVDLEDLDDLCRIANWGAYIFLTNELAKKPSTFLVIPFSRREREAKPPEVEVDDRRARREKEHRVSELRTNERLLSEHARQLEIEASKSPIEAGRVAAFVLVYLAAGGVVWPLLLMARMRVGLSTATAWLTFGLVTTGLAAVLGYVVLAITRGRGLHTTPAGQSPTRHPVGRRR